MAKLGRKSKIDDPAAVNKIVKAIKAGCTNEQAAGSVGISKKTLQEWLQRAEDPKEPEKFREFRDRITRARDEGIVSLAEIIRKASGRDWHAAKFILSVRSKEWVEKKGIDPEVISKLLDESVGLLLDIIEKRCDAATSELILRDFEQRRSATGAYLKGAKGKGS